MRPSRSRACLPATLFGALLWACGGPRAGPPASSPTTSGAVGKPASSGPAVAATTQTDRPADAAGVSAITRSAFGTVDGKDVSLYTMTNARGWLLKVTNYGAIVTELRVPDRKGKLADIVAGYENFDGYLKNTPHFGATIGRVANRIRNAQFELEGKTYQLAVNDPPNHLHGGRTGWDKVVWAAEPRPSPEGPSIRLAYVSKDGEEGYPGTVTASVTYTLTNDGEFRIEMEATTDRTTIVNMAHHTYWNLGGFDSGTILDEELTLHAHEYTPGDPVVPTGVVKPVSGTPFDFTSSKLIGRDLKAVVVTGNPLGYDHNWVVDGDPHALRPVARVSDRKSGRVMTLDADQPGVQFYAGTFLDGTSNGKGATYEQYGALCLETQKFPNSINVPAWRNEVILKPGQTYRHVMVHRFSTE